MKDYIINDCKVCLNPDVLVEYNDKDIEFLIDGMECEEGAWICGHTLQMQFSPYYGSVHPISTYDRPATKDIAIKKEMEGFRKVVEHILGEIIRYGKIDDYGNKTTNNRGIQACQRAIRWAEQQLGPKQLTFDF